MRKKTSYILQIVIIGLLLAAGVVSYYLFDPRQFTSSRSDLLFLFFNGYFSDLLWCIALYLFVVILSQKKFLGFWSQLSLLLLPFITEALQFLDILKVSHQLTPYFN
jgi:hypothetical protein